MDVEKPYLSLFFNLRSQNHGKRSNLISGKKERRASFSSYCFRIFAEYFRLSPVRWIKYKPGANSSIETELL